jgi:hypothetical protein
LAEPSDAGGTEDGLTTGMIRSEAEKRWGKSWATRQRKTSNGWGCLCEVGYVEPNGEYPWLWPMIVMGSGPSWVQAFKNADEHDAA